MQSKKKISKKESTIFPKLWFPERVWELTCRGMYFPFSLRMRLRRSTWLNTNKHRHDLRLVTAGQSETAAAFRQEAQQTRRRARRRKQRAGSAPSRQNVDIKSERATGQTRLAAEFVSPVRNLLQVDLFVAVEQLGDVVADDPDEEGDEDDGQDHPHPNAGVQQELWTGHRSLFNQPTQTEAQTGRRSERGQEGKVIFLPEK